MPIEFKEVCIECVFKGAFIKIKAEGSPSEVIDSLKESDPDVKFKDSFPVYGRGGKGGNRDTKTSKIVSITIKAGNGGAKFIDLACHGDSGDVSVSVGRKKVEDFLTGAKDRLEEANKEKMDQAQATILLMSEEQRVPIKYFDIDGKCYFDSFGS
jgi:hypothetical protein